MNNIKDFENYERFLAKELLSYDYIAMYKPMLNSGSLSRTLYTCLRV